MPKYYCEYCKTTLTHDWQLGRKQHNYGRQHQTAVREYYTRFLQSNVQVASAKYPMTFVSKPAEMIEEERERANEKSWNRRNSVVAHPPTSQNYFNDNRSGRQDRDGGYDKSNNRMPSRNNQPGFFPPPPQFHSNTMPGHGPPFSQGGNQGYHQSGPRFQNSNQAPHQAPHRPNNAPPPLGHMGPSVASAPSSRFGMGPQNNIPPSVSQQNTATNVPGSAPAPAANVPHFHASRLAMVASTIPGAAASSQRPAAPPASGHSRFGAAPGSISAAPQPSRFSAPNPSLGQRPPPLGQVVGMQSSAPMLNRSVGVISASPSINTSQHPHQTLPGHQYPKQ